MVVYLFILVGEMVLKGKGQWRNVACSRPRSVAICCPPKIFVCPLKKKKKVGYFFLPPPLQLFAPPGAKRCPTNFFHAGRTLHWTGKYTNKPFFSLRKPKSQENFAPLIRRPPAQRGLRGPKLRHWQGVGLCLSKKVRNSLISYVPISERVLTARLRSKHLNISVVVAYAPTDGADDGEKERFYNVLSDTFDELP